MLHVVDNLLTSEEIPALRQLCDLHGDLKQASEGRNLFSWIPADPSDRSGRSLHAADQQSLMDRYIRQRLGPLLDRFAPPKPLVTNGGATPTTTSTGTSTSTKRLPKATVTMSCRCCPRSSTPTSAVQAANC